MATIILNKPLVLATAQKQTLPLVRKTTRQILTGAKRLAPKGSHLSGSGERRPGQSLAASLNSSITVTTTHVTGEVGSRKDYAASIHQGSKPHVIRSKRGKNLKFQWDRGQHLVFGRRGHRVGRIFFYFSEVNHPGNKRPVRYLTTPMHQFGRANGFKTTTLVGVTRGFLP